MLERHTESDHGDVCRNEKFHGYLVGWSCPYGCIPRQDFEEEPTAPYCEAYLFGPCRIDGKMFRINYRINFVYRKKNNRKKIE